jgi:transposase-like protein
MDHRIRLALGMPSSGRLSGEIEADETYIGGKARNMQFEKRVRMLDGGRGTVGKVAVLGLRERHGKGKSKVRLTTAPNTSREDIHPIIRKNVKAGSAVYTDSHSGYEGLDEYFHEFVNHAETYARGKVHSTGLRTSGVF